MVLTADNWQMTAALTVELMTDSEQSGLELTGELSVEISYIYHKCTYSKKKHTVTISVTLRYYIISIMISVDSWVGSWQLSDNILHTHTQPTSHLPLAARLTLKVFEDATVLSSHLDTYMGRPSIGSRSSFSASNTCSYNIKRITKWLSFG